MLLTKTAEIKWNSTNRKWYEEKGYSFTKIGDKFEVKTVDLTIGSHIYVKVKCDRCGITKEVEWREYYRSECRTKKEVYYCNKCSCSLIGKDKKYKVRKTKSFEQWCIKNKRQDVLNRWDYELNDCKPSEILHSTHTNYYFKCPTGIHDSELKKLSTITSRQNYSVSCIACNSLAQWGINNLGEDFLDKYWDYDKNIYSPWEVNHFTSKKSVWIKCQSKHYHESYKVISSNFVIGARCPYCSMKQVNPLESMGKILENKGLLGLWSERNKKAAYNYAPKSNILVWWKCPCGKHEDYRRRLSTSLLYDFRCPECSNERNESYLQEKVRLYLETLGYTILHEHKCSIVPKNPKTKMSMPFDNEIRELSLIIEVHGSQHYRKSTGYFGDDFDLHKRQLYDRYKRVYAKLKEYDYLEIPYWTDNEQEEWKQVIDNKINELLHNQDQLHISPAS